MQGDLQETIEKIEQEIDNLLLLQNFDSTTLSEIQKEKEKLIRQQQGFEKKLNKNIKTLLENMLKLFEAKSNDELDYALLAYPNMLYKILDALFGEYVRWEYHYHTDFTDDPIYKEYESKGLSNEEFFDFIKIHDIVNPRFLKQHPYFPALARLQRIRESKISDAEQFMIANLNEYNELQKIIRLGEVIYPLNYLINLLQNAMIACRFQVIANLKIALFLIESTVRKMIPFSKRDQNPYSLINLTAIENLGQMASKKGYEALLTNELPEMQNSLAQLYEIFKMIRKYESAINAQQEVKNISEDSFVTPPAILNRTYYYTDIETLKYLCKCLEWAENIQEDILVNRYAILRLFIIIGEALKNLSLHIKHPSPIIEKLKLVRDQIVHPSGETAVSILRSLIYSSTDNCLYQICCKDFKSLKSYFKSLLAWRESNSFDLTGNISALVCVDLPLDTLNSLVPSLLKKFRLSMAEREELIKTLPQEDEKRTTEKRDELFRLLSCKLPLPKNKGEFINLFSGLGARDRILGKYYCRLIAQQRFLSVFAAVKESNIIFSGIITVSFEEQIDLIQFDTKNNKIVLSNKLKDFIKNNIRKPLSFEFIQQIEKTSDLSALVKIFEKLAEEVKIKENEIKEIIDKIPENIIQLKPIKEKLINLIFQNICDKNSVAITPLELCDHLKTLGCTSEDNKSKWISAFYKLCGDDNNNDNYSLNKALIANKPKKGDAKIFSLEELFKHALVHLDRIINKINGLKDLLNNISIDVFLENKSLILACEFIIGQFIHSIDKLLKCLDSVKDYSDIRAQSVFLTHPIDELIKELTSCKQQRNSIFHLDLVYQNHFQPEWLTYNHLYGYIEHITQGILYKDAIIIGNGSVNQGPIRARSLLDKIKETKQEILSYQEKIKLLKSQKIANNLTNTSEQIAVKTTEQQLSHTSIPESSPVQAIATQKCISEKSIYGKNKRQTLFGNSESSSEDAEDKTDIFVSEKYNENVVEQDFFNKFEDDFNDSDSDTHFIFK